MMNFWRFVFLFYCGYICSQGANYESEFSKYKKTAKSVYKQKDSCIYYIDKMIDLSYDNGEWEDLIKTFFFSNDVALYHYDYSRYKQNLKKIDSIYAVKELKNLPDGFDIRNTIDYYHGFYHLRLDNLSTSKKFFKKIISAIEKDKDSLLMTNHKGTLSAAYNYLAKIHLKEGKYEQAIQVYHKNIRFVKGVYKKNNTKLYSTYSLLAEVLKKQGMYRESNSYYLKTIPFFESKKSANSLISSAFNAAQNYTHLSALDSARFYLNIVKPHLAKTHIYNARFHEIYSEILSKEGNYYKALEELDNALDFMKTKLDGRKHSNIAKIYNKIGLLHIKFNQPQKAIENYNLALSQFSESKINFSINKIVKFEILKNKVSALNLLKKYHASLQVVNTSLLILDDLKPTFKTNKDKFFLVENTAPIFESSLEAIYNLYLENNKDGYIAKAFYIAEKSKSALLLETLLNTQAYQYTNVPTPLIEKEKQLKIKITEIEKRINRKSTHILENQLFELKQNHRSIIDTLEKKYKKYYDLKYNTQVSDLDNVQESLDNDQAIISYFYGDNAMYVITVGKEYKNLDRIEIPDSLKDNIKEVYDLFSNSQSDTSLLASKTKYIYDLILKPFITNVPQEHLIIMPDGLLNYIPFESLNTSDNRIRYVIEDKSISYINSATLLAHLDQKQNNNRVLAFAPSFEGVQKVSVNRNKLLPLIYNTKEAASILNHFKGDLYQDNEASLQNFRSNMSDFNVIHLATHAFFNDVNPEYSYLAFSTEDDENLLYVSDIYNTHVAANMVTLSACETGIGKLKRGEGFLSLSRSFFYAGASSITSTLWKVNDASSSQLMDFYYLHLSKGVSKNEALRKAKIDFITKHKDIKFSHPYYWSGFIVSGNVDPLVSHNLWIWILIVTVLFVGLLSAFALWKRSRVST